MARKTLGQAEALREASHLARDGFRSLLLLPFRMERLRLNRATEDETLWLLNLLRGLSRGITFRLTEDHLIEGLHP